MMHTFIQAMRRCLPIVLVMYTGLAQAQATAPRERMVTGFRSAQFGMTADEVKQAIANDFKPAANALSQFENPKEKTNVLLLRLPQLEPGPGPVAISYILGATTKKLMHVNVVWMTGPKPTEAQRNEVAAAGVLLRNYFTEQAWLPGKVGGGVTDGDRGVLLFAATDGKQAGIELYVKGVSLTGPAGTQTQPEGPAQLRIAYISNMAKPDIATIKPGAF